MVARDETTGLGILTVRSDSAESCGAHRIRSDASSCSSVLQKHFDHVVIDSPPVSSFTDGVLISTMVDGVLLVVHGGKSSRHIVRRSKQLLQEVGAKIFGVVLNNIEIQSHDYYYYQRYYGQKYQQKEA